MGVHFGSLLGSILGHFGVPFLVTLGATDGHHLKPRERHREELLWEPLGELPWELSWAFVGAFVRALWNTSWAKQGRGVAGSTNIKEKHCILCASCAEPSEARLRAADDSTLFLFVSSVSKEIEDASDLQKRASF